MSSLATANDRMAIPRDSRAAAATDAGRPAIDEAELERLHRRTSQALWSYLRRLTGDPAMADDVHQESYLRYLERPPEKIADAGPEDAERRQSAYLFRIATNLVHDRWRRQKRERGWLRRDRSHDRPAVAPKTPEGSFSVDFDAAFRRLEPRQRSLLWLAHVEGCRHQEIAEILGLKTGSIKVLLFRARRRLAGLLRARGMAPESWLQNEETS